MHMSTEGAPDLYGYLPRSKAERTGLGQTEARIDALNCLPYNACSWEARLTF